MSDNKTNILQTVIEDLNTKSRGTVKTGGKTAGLNGKVLKSGKARRTKRVIVNVPSIHKRLENEHKIFPKGIESVRRSLEEIKEEAIREGKVDEENIQINGDPEKENVSKNNNVENISKAIDDVNSGEGKKIVSDPIYGMFTRTNTERSLLSTRSDSCSILLPAKSPNKDLPKRPKTSKGWSKKDLEIFLPRKSFFSVHDNTLSAAGFDVRSDEERKRPEWRKFLKMHTVDELYPKEKTEEIKPEKSFGIADDESDEDDAYGLENVETAMSADNKDATSGTKPRRKQTKKPQNTEKDEYKPLYDYLKHIHDNPEEYIQQAKYSAKNTDHKHPSYLVRLGRAFRRGHHGAVRHNIYLHAIHGLKPKMIETVTQQRNTRGGDKGMIKKETNESSEQTNQDETDLQRLKTRAENWMRPLTTQQLLKGKEMALKDIGEEDINISKWWLAFKSCHYLRIPPHFYE